MRKGVWRIDGEGASAVGGRVIWAPKKSLWNTGMLLLAITLAPTHFSWSALLLFLILSYIILLVGHSIGMHRRLSVLRILKT